ncbi:hypothetical protein BCCGELA001_28550 [Bradyrhizobium sp. CCGE-LA001]|nr:hypothetical protein BCCGELA001_28550 [Bradyrhizobium sp. CCGE-LA001]
MHQPSGCWTKPTVAFKNPASIAAVVSALRVVHGDEVARTMLVEGMNLAKLMDTMFSAPITHREAVRYVADAIDDFATTPKLGPVWHLRYLYDDQPGSLRVVDMEIATPAGTLSSKDVWLRLCV